MAAQSVALATKTGCSDPELALQHLQTQHDKGRLKIEEVDQAREYLEEEIGDGIPEDIDGVIAVLVPIVQKVEGRRVLTETLLKAGKDDVPLTEIADEFQKVADIGKKKGSATVVLSADVSFLNEVLSNRLVDPLPLGIDDLDMYLGGGLERKALGAVCAPSSAGKSFFLCHVAVEAVLQGYNVAYLSLELSEAQVLERIYANLVNMTIDEMLNDPVTASNRMQLWKNEGIGKFCVIHETPRATTPNHFRTWLKDLDERDIYCEVMICDFADKMVSKLGTKRSSYDDQGVVYDELRDLTFEREGWGWTASQAKGSAYGKKKVGATHFADSLNKLRSLDLAIGLARTEEDEVNDQVRFSVPKRRSGEKPHEVGPVDWDPARGRIVYVTRPQPWD